MTDIAQAYVRLRPNMAGFQQEAEAQVKGVGLSAGKLFAAAFGAAAGIGLAKKTVEAAIEQQTAISQTQQIVKQAGGEWTVYGKNLKDNFIDLADQSGFSVAELAQAFNRLEPGVKNTTKAYDLLVTATETARGRGQDLTLVSTSLAKAQAGQTSGLGRLGVQTKAYTAAQDDVKRRLLEVSRADTAVAESKARHYTGTLKLSDAELALSRLTEAQRKQLTLNLQAQLDSAKASDKQTTAQRALAELGARYKGQNVIFSGSTAGQIVRFHEAVNELEVTIGKALLPTISAAAEKGRDWAQQLAHSGEAADALKGGLHDVAGAVEAIGTAFQASRPALQLLAEATQAVGPGPILAAATAYYTLTKAQALATVIGGKYDALVKAGVVIQQARIDLIAGEVAAREEAAAAAIATAHAEALAIEEVTLGLTARSAALARDIEFTLLDVAAQDALAASAGVTTVAIEAETVAAGGMRAASLGLLGILTGPTAIIAGVAALAGGIYYLSTRTSEVEKHVNALTDALGRQTQAAHNAAAALDAKQKDTNALPGQRDARAQAFDDIDEAMLKYNKHAASGHATRQELAQDARDIAIAQARWRDTNRQVRDTEKDKADKVREVVQAHRDEAKATRDAADAGIALVSSHILGSRFGPVGPAKPDTASIKAAYNDLNRSADDSSKHITGRQREQLRALADWIKEHQRRPTQIEIDVILNTPSLEAQLSGIENSVIGSGLGKLLRGGLPALDAPVAAGGGRALVPVKHGGKKPSELGHDAATAYTTSFVQTIDAGDIAKALADAITSAQQQMVSAAGSLAGSVGGALDARLVQTEKGIDAADARIQAKISARQTAATARSTAQAAGDAALKLRELQTVLGTGALTADQAQQLQQAKNAVLDAQDSIANASDQGKLDALAARKTLLEQQNELEKTAADRRIADLTDELNRGLITQAQYVKGVRALLAKEGVTYKQTGALLGKSFADGFSDQLHDVVAQARALGGVGKEALRKAPRGTAPVSPVKDEAAAIQAFIDSVAGSGGRFNVKNADKLPAGVDLVGLLSAASSQRSESAYREKTDKKTDTQIHYAGETRDHTAAILAELRKPRPVQVHLTIDEAAKKRKIAQATKP